jgi:putative nucleotidyltransferase with HDIG domain
VQLNTVSSRQPSQDFSLFSVEGLVDNSTTDFDLYIDLEPHFILYSGAGYRWERQELTELLGNGYGTLYIRKTDLPKAKMYASLAKLPLVEKSKAPTERIRTIEDVGAKFTQCLFEGELAPSCVDKAAELTSSLVDCVMEDPGCIKFLSNLADHDYYTYYHSVRVAAYATAIALKMGQGDAHQLRTIALGAIFHDIGKKDVPLGVLNKSGPLTDAEWKQMRSHPQTGHATVQSTLMTHVSREIILHHHEKRNGKGYPHGLDQHSLLPEVQIATLADIFDALTSARSYQTKRSRYEALDFIKHRLLSEEVCPEAFKALVRCLAT